MDDTVKDRIIEAGYVLYNHFGPTEATVDPLSIRCSREKVTIGRPIANMKCYVVDPFNALTPIGVPGEICLAGEGLARGYLNNPAITAEKFVRSPFEKNGVMYKTGDLCRVNPGKNVEFLGRIDRQIKIRGIRVELGEIETILAACPGVKEVVVAAKQNRSGGNYLIAYFTSRQPGTETDLRKYLSALLPGSMIPSYFVALERMPLTPHGKIDVKAFPEPGAKEAREIVTPGDEIESFLTGVWQQVLDNRKISIYDNFFHIGGNSLLIMKTKAMLAAEYPGVTVMALFTYPTISALAQFIRDLEKDSPGITTPGITINAAIALPTEYFSDFHHSPGESDGSVDFKFSLNETITAKAREIANNLDIEYGDIFLALILYAFAEIAGKEKITLQTMTGPVNRICSLTVDVGEPQDPQQLYRLVHKSRINSKARVEYTVEDLDRVNLPRSERSVIPFVYKKDTLNSKYEFLKYFDIAIEMNTDRENQTGFFFEYNNRRLNQGGMEKFVNLYADLLVNI